jgi:hypothetical protein
MPGPRPHSMPVETESCAADAWGGAGVNSAPYACRPAEQGKRI